MLIIFSNFSHSTSQGFSCGAEAQPPADEGSSQPTQTEIAPNLSLKVPQAHDGLLVLGGSLIIATQLVEPVAFPMQERHGLHLLLIIQIPRLPLVLTWGLHLAQEPQVSQATTRQDDPSILLKWFAMTHSEASHQSQA